MTVGNCEHLIEHGSVWISGTGNITMTPGRESVEVCFGWSYSRFFTAEKNVSDFIDLCAALAKQLGCAKIYFLPDSACEAFNYQQIAQQIAGGELTEGKESNRLSEYCDHDIYAKEIPDTAE